MKFYSKPEIEALALESVDVIETSTEAAQSAKNELLANNDVKVTSKDMVVINQQVAEMSTNWQW